MRRLIWVIGSIALATTACNRSVNVQQERDTLMAADRAWSQTTKDADKFAAYFVADGRAYPPGIPLVTGADAIRKTYAGMSASPGFALQWTPARAEVSASGDLGETAGTYEMTMGGVDEKGKYVTVWQKQPDGSWKVTDDIFNADTAGPPPSQQAMVTASDVKWGDAPPVLPAGAKLAVLSGDPGKAGPFAIRLQMPAGYTIAAHWHPSDENLTVLSGTFALGMGDKFDKTKTNDLAAGGYAVLPANMHHFATAKTATTVQINSMGPFVITYVNPADDPSKGK